MLVLFQYMKPDRLKEIKFIYGYNYLRKYDI